MRTWFNNLKALARRKLADSGLRGTIDGRTELLVEHIRGGKVIGKRVVLDKVITTAFVNDIVAAMRGLAAHGTFDDYKFHGSGTGTGAEAVGDPNLGTPVQDTDSNYRVTGTQEEGDNPNIYKSVATITYGGNHAITEHGLFNNVTNAAGVLMDRTKFDPVNVVDGDSIQFTYTGQFNAGG